MAEDKVTVNRVYVQGNDGKKTTVYHGVDYKKAAAMNGNLADLFNAVYGIYAIGMPGIPYSCLFNSGIYEGCGCGDDGVPPNVQCTACYLKWHDYIYYPEDGGWKPEETACPQCGQKTLKSI